MSDLRTVERVELTVRLDNTRPVEVGDLGRSLQALGKQYEDFVIRHGFEPAPANAHLFIAHLETGSIIVTLRTLLDQASFLLKDLDVLAGFVANLQDIINFFLGHDMASKDHAVTADDAERISTVVDPVAKDNGAKLTVSVTGNTAPVTVNAIVLSSERANALQNGVRRFLGSGIPNLGRFERELMYLQQMRGDIKSKTGDRGIIEKFSARPVKLHFMTPAVKASIVDQPENPFKMAYVVDGEVSTVKGEPGLYKIAAVHEAIEKP
jgi:hypothetical protein